MEKEEIRKHKQCNVCGSTNTYFTIEDKICRACGKKEKRSDINVD